MGLHDREIPPDKILKLSKIGSGGFKDVFLGKLKNRKVAVAEFRGQLNASECPIHVNAPPESLILFRMTVDIKELKLLGDFNHPNIVRFVCIRINIFPCASDGRRTDGCQHSD